MIVSRPPLSGTLEQSGSEDATLVDARGFELTVASFDEKTPFPFRLGQPDVTSRTVAATIGGVDATAVAVFVGIGAALIGATAALAGVFFGARWQAEGELAHWRRDRLLQFCSDFLAAGAEAIDAGWAIQGGDRAKYPQDAERKMRHFRACIFMLAPQLDDWADAYSKAVHELLTAKPKTLKGRVKLSWDTGYHQARFAGEARKELVGLDTQPSVWQQLRSRLRRRKSDNDSRPEPPDADTDGR